MCRTQPITKGQHLFNNPFPIAGKQEQQPTGSVPVLSIIAKSKPALPGAVTVLILDGNLEIGAHVRSKLSII